MTEFTMWCCDKEVKIKKINFEIGSKIGLRLELECGCIHEVNIDYDKYYYDKEE